MYSKTVSRGDLHVRILSAKEPESATQASDSQDGKEIVNEAGLLLGKENAIGKINVAGSASECLELSVSLQGISKVLFIDAGNCFNPFFIHRNFRDKINTKEALENIFISRPFTIYQLKEAISQIDSQLITYKVLIIHCIDDLFYEDGIKIWEAREVFSQTMGLLEKSVKQYGSICFISFVGKYFRKVYEGASAEGKQPY
jgi:hypothetical protein